MTVQTVMIIYKNCKQLSTNSRIIENVLSTEWDSGNVKMNKQHTGNTSSPHLRV